MDEIYKLLSDSPETNCDLDPIPISLLKQCSSVLFPTITNIINLSLSTSIFPDQFNNCSVHPHLKKPSLDRENLANYFISLICLNSLKELSKPVSLNIYLITISSTLSSQPTSKVILLKLLYCLSMTTSSKL